MSDVHLIPQGPLVELRLDNPAKMNALDVGMLQTLDAHLDAIEHEPSLRCVLLTAEGDRAFCTGADINGWGDLSPAEFARHWVRDGHRIFDRLARLSKPTLAVLNGHAFGGGLELAAACDLRVMAPGATTTPPGCSPRWLGNPTSSAAASIASRSRAVSVPSATVSSSGFSRRSGSGCHQRGKFLVHLSIFSGSMPYALAVSRRAERG